MRAPNGAGCVFKLPGKRRKPWTFRITKGWDDMGKQLYDYAGYYETRKEAELARAEYNMNPYDLQASKITFEDVFELWKAQKVDTWSKITQDSYNSAFKNLNPLHKNKITEIRTRHLQGVFNDCNLGNSSKNNMKIVCSGVFKFALKNDIIEKDYSQFIDKGKTTPKKQKKPFTQDEISLIWDNLGKIPNIDIILILIYTGMRPMELFKIENENVFIGDKYMIGGIKTAAGKNRIIPINEKMLPLIKKRYNAEHKYLISLDAGNNQTKYRDFFSRHTNKIKKLKWLKWFEIMAILNIEHTPHECRHTFASLMDSAGANKLIIKKIMGHATQDITDNVYIHKNLNELLKAVNLI